MATNYIQVLGQYFPATQAYVAGGADPTIYTNVSWVSASIPQSTLDALASYVPIGINTTGLNLPPSTTNASRYFEGLNLTGATITLGTPIYIIGVDATSGLPLISSCDANLSTKMPCDGITSVAIATGTVGSIVATGLVGPFNTSSWTIGSQLYVASGGGLTSTLPTGSLIVQNVGTVLVSHATAGYLTVEIADIENDRYVRNSATDTTGGYLSSKISAGSGIVFTTNNSGGNESITIASSVVQSNQAAIQVETNATGTTSGTANTFTSITFAQTDVLNNSAVLNWVVGSAAVVTALVAGPYYIEYSVPFASAGARTLTARVLKNGTTAIPGSISTIVQGNTQGPYLTNGFNAILAAGDTLQLQVSSTTTSNTISSGVVFGAHQLIGAIGPAGAQGTQGIQGNTGSQGIQGVPGPTGSGSNINVYNQGVAVTGTPFSILNLVGNVSVTNAGSGQANISIASSIPLALLTYYAAHFDNPNSVDWAVNALAPLVADPTNTGLTVRQFDDTTSQGVGIMLAIPSTATSMNLSFVGRAQTAPTSRVVQHAFYFRALNNGAALGTWSAANALTAFSLGNNAYNQYFNQTFSLSSLGLTAGLTYQIELVRVTTGVTGGTNLTGNWLLSQVGITFN